MRRYKDTDWEIIPDKDNRCTWVQVQAAVLMDIRDELKKLNQTITYSSLSDVATQLRAIRRNTAKPRVPK